MRLAHLAKFCLPAVALWFVSSAALAQSAPPTDAAKPSIVELAQNSGNLTTLVKALQAAGLVDTLNGDGPFTVFAPTDAAFEALGADKLNSVVADKRLLTRILTYHVVKGAVAASDVAHLARVKAAIPTVAGAAISFSENDGSFFINGDTKIIATDIVARNGVIHLIDKVLIPPQESSAAASTAGGRKLPAEERGIRSINELVPAVIAFANSSGRGVKVYWLDESGQRKLYATLKPGESYVQQTFLTHPWLITDEQDNGQYLYYADGQRRTLSIPPFSEK